ncbi:hypothetical protein GCK32_021045, partial [Trichostrongylus colubriformis]
MQFIFIQRCVKFLNKISDQVRGMEEDYQ